MHKIFQGYYNKATLQHMDPLVTPVDITFNLNHPLCEYNIFKTLLENGIFDLDSGPAGLISSKFKLKSQIELSTFSQYCAWAFGKGADVAFVNPLIGGEAIYQHVWETDDIFPIFKALFTNTEIQTASLMPKSVFAFCNYFVGNAKFWSRYIIFCEKILQKIELLEAENPLLYNIIYNSSGYKRRPELDFRPFIIERLFSTFLSLNKDIIPAGLGCDETMYEKKFGAKGGKHLYEMSQIKNRAINDRDLELLKKWHEIRKPLVADARAIWEHDDPVYSYHDSIVNYVGHPL